MQVIAPLLLVLGTEPTCSNPGREAPVPGEAPRRIFRHVRIGFGDIRINLGEPLPELAAPLVESLEPRTFIVRVGMFSGADAICLTIDDVGLVASIVFAYNPAEDDFDAKVRRYAQSLGPPEFHDIKGGRVARWQDQCSRFELVDSGGLNGLLTDRKDQEAPNPPLQPTGSAGG